MVGVGAELVGEEDYMLRVFMVCVMAEAAGGSDTFARFMGSREIGDLA